jgi:hypothetical protein
MDANTVEKCDGTLDRFLINKWKVQKNKNIDVKELNGRYLITLNFKQSNVMRSNIRMGIIENCDEKICCIEFDPKYLPPTFIHKLPKKQNGELEFIFIITDTAHKLFKNEIRTVLDQIITNTEGVTKCMIVDTDKTLSILLETNHICIHADFTGTSYEEVIDSTPMNQLIGGFIHDTKINLTEYVTHHEHTYMSNAIKPKEFNNAKNTNTKVGTNSTNTELYNGNTMQRIHRLNNIYFDVYVFHVIINTDIIYTLDNIKRVQTLQYVLQNQQEHLNATNNNVTKNILYFLLNPVWNLQEKLEQIVSLAKKNKRCLILLERVTKTNDKTRSSASNFYEFDEYVGNVFQQVIGSIKEPYKLPLHIYTQGLKNSFIKRNPYVEDVVNFFPTNQKRSNNEYKFYEFFGKTKAMFQHTWWMHYYFDPITVCKQGRILSLYGTCWYTTLINMILLTKELRDELHNIWLRINENKNELNVLCPNYQDEQIKCIDYDTCPMYFARESRSNSNDKYLKTVRTMLLRLYANIFIYDYKLHYQDRQTILRLSATIKDDLQDKDRVLDKIEKGNVLEDADIALIEGKHVTSKEIFLTMTSVVDDKTKWSYWDSNTKVTGKPWYIVSTNPTQRVITSTSNVRYILKSAYISIHQEGKQTAHAICGFYCNDMYYIQDPNDEVPYMCPWYDKDKLILFLQQHYIHNSDRYNKAHITLGIYCVEDDVLKIWRDQKNALHFGGGKTMKNAVKDRVIINGYKRSFIVHRNNQGKKYVKINGEHKLLSALKGRYKKALST